MKKFINAVSLCLAVFLFFGCAQQNAIDKNENAGDIVAVAEQFIQLLSEGKYEEASRKFAYTMNREVSPEELERAWKQAEMQGGEFINYKYVSTEGGSGTHNVVIEGLYQGVDALFTVKFDKNNRITGFHINKNP